MRVKEWPSSGVVEKVLDVAAHCRFEKAWGTPEWVTEDALPDTSKLCRCEWK